MPEAVVGLDGVLADEIVWRVAVVASRHRMMARLLPAIVMLAHDVAVDAGPRIAAEIRKAFAVTNGIAAGPDRCTNEDAQQQAEQTDTRSMKQTHPHGEFSRKAADACGQMVISWIR